MPKTFFGEKVRTVFNPYLKNFDIPHEDMADYINSTIISAKIPGIADPGSEEQIHEKGMTRQFKGSLPVLQNISKELTLSFKLKDGFLNWYIMYFNFLDYLDHKNQKLWLGDMHCQLMDFDSNIMSEIIYKEVRITRISDLDLSQADNGVNSTNFDVDFYFTHIDFQMYHNNAVNPRRGDIVVTKCD